MSALDLSCFTIPPEQQTGAGEMNCYKPQTPLNPSQIIAAEIMDNIVDKAFEIILAKSLQSPKVEKITPNVVGDILENIMSPSSNNDETVLLDEEIKKLIKEMKFPPEPKNLHPQGVGDQLKTESEIISNKISTQPKRHTLERKTRLTNLVKHSKQMFLKLMPDSDQDVKRSKSEEFQERIIKVIDLEPGSSSDTQSTAKEVFQTTELEFFQVPSDSKMEMINLEPNTKIQKRRNKEQQDKHEEEEEREIASCSFAKIDDKKRLTESKKKWNIGAKILRYLKRRKH